MMLVLWKVIHFGGWWGRCDAFVVKTVVRTTQRRIGHRCDGADFRAVMGFSGGDSPGIRTRNRRIKS